jgi:hypothetical protein
VQLAICGSLDSFCISTTSPNMQKLDMLSKLTHAEWVVAAETSWEKLSKQVCGTSGRERPVSLHIYKRKQHCQF